MKTIRVATFNVCNYLLTDRKVDGQFYKNYPKPEAEKTALRASIRAVDPDILLLQEIKKPFLEELQKDLKAEGLDYPYAYSLSGRDVQRSLGALSKLKPVLVACHNAIPFTYKGQNAYVKRGLLELRFIVNSKPWSLYTLHLKSKIQHDKTLNDPECHAQRTGEARVLRKCLLATQATASQEALFMIAGDFNDHPNSSALKHLKGFTHKGKLEIVSERLPCCDPQDPSLPAWTYASRYTESWHTVDHVLVSPAFKKQLPKSQAFVGPASMGSDHRIIYVDVLF